MNTGNAPLDLSDTTVDEQFWALVCADEQLCQAEFDEIIAAAWTDSCNEPPPIRAHPGDPLGRPDLPNSRAGRVETGRQPDHRVGDIGAPRWNRERSPPALRGAAPTGLGVQ